MKVLYSFLKQDIKKTFIRNHYFFSDKSINKALQTPEVFAPIYFEKQMQIAPNSQLMRFSNTNKNSNNYKAIKKILKVIISY